MMKLEGMATFVAVAEAGSLSEAARRLRLSKSVVSERLGELERSLGAMLVHRTTRKLTLTEDGAAFLSRATAILQDVETAEADIAERRGTLAGRLRISAPVTFGRMHLGPAIYPFLAAHPLIELTLELDDRRVDVAADGYDAVVRHAPIEDTRLTAWRLAPSRRLLVAAPAYLAKHGTPASLDELAGHRGIFYRHRGVGDWRFSGAAAGGDARVVRAKTVLNTNNGDVMREAAIAGLGLALLPTFIAADAIRSGALQVVDVGASAVEEFIYMAHPEGRKPSAKLRALAEHLRTTFGSPPPWERGLNV